MTWKQAFTSSIGRKLIMALTGIFLILFLVVHVGLNACIWNATGENSDHGLMFNTAANFMGSMVVIRILEIGLFVFIFLHVIQGIMLVMYNKQKRNIGYSVPYGNRGSKWYSRSMGLLGTLILLFLILHWINFWVPSRFTGVNGVDGQPLEMELADGEKIHNLFALMQITFQNLWVVIIYVLGCISLAYHLLHGFNSAFRTLGVHNPKYMKLIQSIGYGFSIIVPFVFAMMPISFYLGWVS
ncbi:MAG: succinate dehydrogenase cytochrome b subunit [Bacteroidetes bacterium]|nr:succinate dehydrogenase cytochrome b subunit [Bacteroidota bacterium]